jgi:hypothetical protein
VRPRAVAVLAALFGLAAAAAIAMTAGLDGRRWSLWSPGGPSSLSALAIAAMAGLWFAGALRLARVVRRPQDPIGRAAALLAAFGAGPLLLALFFYPVAVALGFDDWKEAATATAAALVALAPFVLARAALVRIAEELLLALFAWLGLLVLPALAGDALGQQAARLVIALLRRVGLLP